MKRLFRPSAIALTLVLAGCGGGGGTSASTIPPGNPSVNPTPTVSPSGSVTPTPSPAGSPGAVNTAQITITAPPRTAASGATLSPVTQIIAVIKSINNNASIPSPINPTTVVAVTSNNCSTSTTGSTCTFTLPAPAGTLSTVITEYAGSTYVATGSFTINSTGAAGQVQSFALGAVVGNVGITAPSLTLNVPSTQAVTFVVTDPSGAVVGGTTPFANPLTITDNDVSGATQLQVGNDASTLGSSVPYNSPNSIVNMVYNGNGYGQITLSATGPTAEIATTQGSKKAAYKGD